MAEISKISGVAIADVAKVDAVLKADIANINGLTIPSAVAPPLDTYTAATAGYSVRLLRTAYTGDIMRVRRDSDNVEADVGFDGTNSLSLTSPISNTSDAQSYTDFADFVDHTGTPTDAFCRYWYDQSGNTNDASQTAAVRQPKIYDSSIPDFIKENGNPILNGTYATGAGFSVSLGLSQPFTYAGTGALETIGGWVFGFVPQVFGNALEYRIYANLTFNQSFNLSARQHIMVTKFDGASSDAQALTSSGSISAIGNPGTASGFNYILHRRSTDAASQGAKMQEMIFWNTGQSATNMDGIEQNMDDYFSVS